MDKFSVIRDITLILAISLPVLYLFRKIKVSPIVGFLITGVVMGPSGLQLISQNDQISVMAEVGIILLMFTIGLEFSFSKLLKMKKFFLLFGFLQVFFSVIIAFILLFASGLSVQISLFFSFIVSLSSTAIVLKIYNEKGILDSPHGRITLGILVFQDIAIIPMLIILPLLQTGTSFNITTLAVRISLAITVLTLIVLLSRYIVPRLLYFVSSMRVREIFTATMVVLLLGTAYITHSIGISFSIGAFIAGFIIAESEFSTEITAEIVPFRDIFNSLFFVSAGLMLSVHSLINELGLVMLLSAGVIALKSIVIIAIVRLSGYPSRTAVISGFSMAQLGEFAFILAGSGLEYKIIDSRNYNIFLSVALLTMTITPFLIELIPALLNRLSMKEPISEDEPDDAAARLSNHVIIAGFGLNGRNLVKVLKETGIPYIIIELNPATVKAVRELKEPVLFGDITKNNILTKAGIKRAKVLVYAISDPQSTRVSLALAKILNPSIHAIVRTRYVTEIDELLRLKADSVIPEEFETSLQIFSRVLNEYHIPTNIVLRQINLIRQGSYELLRSESASLSPVHLMDIIAKSVTETFFVEETSPAVNKMIKEIDLRAKSGATILSIVRQDTAINNPSGSEIIRYGDVLVLTGTHQAVDDASDMLKGK